jgi:uncharacterized protein YceH (UPF0502 family)
MGENSGPEVVVYGSDDDTPLNLTSEEVRILGVLIEKQTVTPDTYPLTLNALVNGCNQSTSRDPVVNYDESVVKRALDGLREKKLAFVYSGAESRVVKFGHRIAERLELGRPEIAALCVLLLRGPQTAGEIRNRSGRLFEFPSLPDAETALETLASRQPFPLATKLPRQPGTKESRYAHLLSGTPVMSEGNSSPASVESRPPPTPSPDRLSQLENEVGLLRTEVTVLREELNRFRSQFE